MLLPMTMPASPRTKSMSPSRRRPFPTRPSNSPLKLAILTIGLFFLTYFHTHIPSINLVLPSSLTSTTKSSTPSPSTTTSALPKIAIITFTTSPTSYTHLSLSNHAAYASQQNYDLFVDYSVPNNRDVMWGKFDMLQRIIEREQYEWVWWMDFDTLITNMTVKVEDVIADGLKKAEEHGKKAEDVDWLFTADCNGLNAGSFLVRSHTRSLSFVTLIDAYHRLHNNAETQLSEQDCMLQVLFPSSTTLDTLASSYTKSPYAGHFAMLPQNAINAFPPEIRCYEDEAMMWKQGDFAIHFAGAWVYVHDEGGDSTGVLMRKYEKMVVGRKEGRGIWDDGEVEESVDGWEWDGGDVSVVVPS